MDEERTPDKSLLIAIGIGVAIALLSAIFFPGPSDAVVNHAVAQEVHQRLEACISQGRIYERLPKPKCAGGTYDVPATALSYPLARKE